MSDQIGYTVHFEPNQELPQSKNDAMDRIAHDYITMTFREEDRGKHVYRSYPTCIYPFWAPFWLRRRLPYWLRVRVPYRVETKYDLLGVVGEQS